MLEYIRTSSLKEGDILGRTLYDAKGMVLIKEGCRISNTIIRSIKAQGFKGVYISKSGTEQRDMVHIQEPIIDDLTVIKVLNILRSITKNTNIFDNAWDKQFVKDRKELERYIDEIYTTMKSKNAKNELIFEMEDGRTNDNWFEYHLLNTMMIAMGIAFRLGLDEAVTKGIGIAALMHDVGKMKYPKLLNKRDLSNVERDQLRSHPRVMFDVLSQLSGIWANSSCTYAIWQSHELFDGSGYPNGLSGQKVTLNGYIVGIASRFDNLVHNTPFDDSFLSNDEALELIMGGAKYPVNVVRALTEVVSAYPIGMRVRLSNQDEAVILTNNIGLPMRPNVMIGFHHVDLAKDPEYLSVTITETIV